MAISPVVPPLTKSDIQAYYDAKPTFKNAYFRRQARARNIVFPGFNWPKKKKHFETSSSAIKFHA